MTEKYIVRVVPFYADETAAPIMESTFYANSESEAKDTAKSLTEALPTAPYWYSLVKLKQEYVGSGGVGLPEE